MTKFRKKPVVIDAFQWTGAGFDADAPSWIAGRMITEHQYLEDVPGILMAGSTLRISTLEGEMTASPGDWIIRGVQGELYPCKPDIFAETYEPIGRAPLDPLAVKDAVEKSRRRRAPA